MPRVPTEKDFEILLRDAEKSGALSDVVKEKKDVVFNPLSFLRFDPMMGTALRIQEKTGEGPFDQKEVKEITSDKTIDFAKEVERAGIDGGVRLIKSLLEIPASIIDGAANTNLNSKLDSITRKFLEEHGNPETFSGEIGSILTQYGAPTTIFYKAVGNLGKLKNVKNIDKFLKNKFGKAYTITAGSDIARRSGKGFLALSAADALASDADRPTLLVDKVSEEGKTGRDLAVARLTNKIKYGQEGAIIGGGIPIAGKGLSLLFKYGLMKPGVFAGKIGFKTADTLVAKPLSKLAALDPVVIPTMSKYLRALPRAAVDRIAPGTIDSYKNWRLYSVQDTNSMRRFLKKIDNFLSYFRSMGRNTPESFDVLFRGEKNIRQKARGIEKLIDSIETRTYNLAKANEKLYNTKTTSPASMDKYLDEVMSYLTGKKPLSVVQKPLQITSKALKDTLDKTKKEFVKFLPSQKLGGELRNIIEKDISGYMRKSFAVFTNPNYSVSRQSKIFKDAVNYISKNVKDPDLAERVKVKQRIDKVSKADAEIAVIGDQVEEMIRFAKTANKDPIQILTSISKNQLQMNKFLATGEELPNVIRKLLGEEKNLRNEILQTVSTMSTQSTNKAMYDRLADVLEKQGQLFKNREAAEIALNVPKGGNAIRRVGDIPGLGFLSSKMSKLYGPVDMVNRVVDLKRGPLDDLMKIPFYKNFLQYKTAAQFGKTVLSPATQTRNFSSAGLFAGNRGLLGNRSSLTESIKMVVDDIFNAGKGDAKDELKLIENIQEGIKYGALDENIVAAELSAVLRSIRKGGVRDADELTSLLERKGFLNVAGQKASRVYAGGDNVWKWYAYNWYKSFLTDYAGGSLPKMKKWFREVAGKEFDPKTLFEGERGLKEAIKEASGWYVRNTMPTYSLVPDLIKAIRTTPFGNFVSFPAEMIRTSALSLRTNLREVASDDQVLREMGYRGAMGQFMVLGGLSMATKKIYGAVTGVTQDIMQEYANYVAPDFQRDADLIAITKPKDGIFKVVDMSTFMPYDTVNRPVRAFFQAVRRQDLSPQSIDKYALDVVGSTMYALVEPFVNRTIGLEVLNELRNNKKKEGGSIWSDLDSGEEKISKAIKHFLLSVEPGAFTTGRQLYYGFKEKLSPTGGSYDLENVVFGLGTGIKPQTVNLRKSMNFVLGDLSRIRTEVFRTSPLYRQNMTKKEMIEQFIKEQRDAFKAQQKVYRALNTMIKLSLDEDEIYDEAERRKTISDETIDLILEGAFKPVKYSEGRFEDKVFESEKEIERRGRRDFVNEDDLFPQDALDDVMDQLEDADLNGVFPFDKTTDPEPAPVFSAPDTQQTSEIPVSPLPKTPDPVINKTTALKINPNTNLTDTETALLSPEEQIIRQRQRT